MKRPFANRRRWLAITIVVVAAGVRLINLGWGLPSVEEEAFAMFKAMEMSGWKSGEFDPHPRTAGWPSLSFYIHIGLQHAHYYAGRASGAFDDRRAYYDAFMHDKSVLLILSRLLSVLASIIVVVVAWRVGRRLGGETGALLATVPIALSPLSVQYAQVVAPEAIMQMFSALAVWQIIAVWQHGKLRSYLWAGMWIGLGASIKYTPALFALSLYLAHLLRRREEGSPLTLAGLNDRRLWGAAGTALFSFAATSPFVIAELPLLVQGVSDQVGHVYGGHLGHGTEGSGYWFFVSEVLAPALGPAGLIIAVVALVYAAATRRGSWLVLAMCVVPYFALVGSFRTQADRYVLSILLPVALGLAAVPILVSVVPGRFRKLILVAATLAVFVPPAMGTIAYHERKARPSTHRLANDWAVADIPADALVALEMLTLIDSDLESGAQRFHHVRIPMHILTPEISNPYYDVRWFTDFDYIMISSSISKRYTSQPERFQSQVDFYDRLDRDWIVVREFDGSQYEGPTITVYRNPSRSPRPADATLDPALYDRLRGESSELARLFLTQMASCFGKRGWDTKAADVYRNLIELCPGCLAERKTYAIACLELGRDAEAVRASEEYVRLRPDDPAMHLIMGMAYANLGRVEDARKAAGRALEADPNYARARQFLSRLEGMRQ